MPAHHVTDATFEQEVLRSDLPVLVDFWAAWCAPCRQVAPILEELADDYEDRLKVAKLDVDESPATAAHYGIQSIPTLIMFRGGEPSRGIRGALPKAHLVKFVDSELDRSEDVLIAVRDLSALIGRREPVHVFDLRPEGDFSRSHILGSRCVAEGELEDELRKLPSGERVVLVCRLGDRSGRVARALRAAFPQVAALEKGLLEWEGSQLPTYSDREESELRA